MRATVLYSNTADYEEVLTVTEGDIITVLDQVDDSWWKGDLRGRVGYFPRNYVELLPTEEVSQH